MKKQRLLWEIFISLFKIGLFTFGGGYAMIALLENEYVSKRGWLDKEEFLDLVAIAESTPGPIAINASTYIGYKTAGLAGATVGTVAMCLPSFMIIYTISLFLDKFLEISLIASAFHGIQVCVVYLILSAGIKMLRGMKKNALNISIVSAVVLCMVAFSLLSVKFSSISYILISAAVGLAVYFAGLIKGKEAEK